MAVKIRLKRFGKMRAPYYRIVVMDSRSKRDGRAIEEIGKYHPTEEPSYIEVDSERAQYWLSVGAQPSEQVAAILKITGDWQKFKGLPGQEGTLKTKAPKEAFVAPEKGSVIIPEAITKKAKVESRGPPRPKQRPPRLSKLLAEALEHLVRGIVDSPEDVKVSAKNNRRGDTLEVRVHQDDLGRVIGRQGRTARALRTVVAALADGEPVRVDVVDTDRRR